MGSFLRKQPCYLFILIILYLGTHEAKTLSSDGEALLAFKKAVTNSDGAFLNWYEQDADPCNWKGVGCDSHSKRVVNLYLQGNYLSGYIPSEFGDLVELESLTSDSTGARFRSKEK